MLEFTTKVSCSICKGTMSLAELPIHLENVHVGPSEYSTILIQCNECPFQFGADKLHVMIRHCYHSGHSAEGIDITWDRFITSEVQRLRNLINSGLEILNSEKYSSKQGNKRPLALNTSCSNKMTDSIPPNKIGQTVKPQFPFLIEKDRSPNKWIPRPRVSLEDVRRVEANEVTQAGEKDVPNSLEPEGLTDTEGKGKGGHHAESGLLEPPEEAEKNGAKTPDIYKEMETNAELKTELEEAFSDDQIQPYYPSDAEISFQRLKRKKFPEGNISEPKDFVNCNICNSALTKGGYLLRNAYIHTLTHDPQLFPYSCKNCGYRSNEKKRVTRHLRTHKQLGCTGEPENIQTPPMALATRKLLKEAFPNIDWINSYYYPKVTLKNLNRKPLSRAK